MFDGSQSLVTLPTAKSRDHSLEQIQQTKSFANLAKSRSNLMNRKVAAIGNNEDPYSESTASMSVFKEN